MIQHAERIGNGLPFPPTGPLFRDGRQSESTTSDLRAIRFSRQADDSSIYVKNDFRRIDISDNGSDSQRTTPKIAPSPTEAISKRMTNGDIELKHYNSSTSDDINRPISVNSNASKVSFRFHPRTSNAIYCRYPLLSSRRSRWQMGSLKGHKMHFFPLHVPFPSSQAQPPPDSQP